MRGATSSDGKMSGNAQLVASHDSAHKTSSGDGESGDIGAFVQQHGPADKIEIQHDHAGGQHSVTSHHGGKKHHSKHGSAEEAHAHAKQAAGIQDEPDVNDHDADDMPMKSAHTGASAGYL